MLLRLGICLEVTSYIFGIIFIVNYVTSFLTQNEAFYKTEIDYVKRVTNLPAYTICPAIKSSFISKQLNRLGKPNTTEAIDFVKGILKRRKKYCRNCDHPGIKTNFQIHLRELFDEMIEPCENFLMKCEWNGEPFQCCRHFQPILSNDGICYSLNSAHSKEPGLSPRDMTTSFQKPEAILNLEVSTTVRIHIHDNKILNFPPVPKIRKGGTGEIIYKFTEWTEDSTSWNVPREMRNCTLIGETEVHGYNLYSQSGCRLRCEAVQQNEYCRCKHHLLPGSENDCDFEGLICLDGISNRKTCECLEECTKMEVSYVQYSVERSTGRTSKIIVRLSAPPIERMVLTSRTTLLDMIVTLSCLSRLVTNQSLHQLWRSANPAILHQRR